MTRSVVTLVFLAFLGVAGLVSGAASSSSAELATPGPATAVTISNELLIQAAPVEIADPALALRRVTIMPGATIPIHHHPGTQISAIVQGTLTYSVFSGTVEWYRASAPDEGPHLIGPGETVQLPAGDTLVENPQAIHQGGNNGNVPVVIYLSTYFPADAPAAILDATPVP